MAFVVPLLFLCGELGQLQGDQMYRMPEKEHAQDWKDSVDKREKHVNQFLCKKEEIIDVFPTSLWDQKEIGQKMS